MFGVSAMQGWRITMEDAHAAVLDLQTADDGKEHKAASVDDRLSFFGVYDGHGGDRVALYAGDNIHKIIAKQEAFKKGNVEQALRDGFLAADRAILNGTAWLCVGIATAYLTNHLDPKYEDEVSGCTASVAVLSKTRIYVVSKTRGRPAKPMY